MKTLKYNIEKEIKNINKLYNNGEYKYKIENFTIDLENDNIPNINIFNISNIINKFINLNKNDDFKSNKKGKIHIKYNISKCIENINISTKNYSHSCNYDLIDGDSDITETHLKDMIVESLKSNINNFKIEDTLNTKINNINKILKFDKKNIVRNIILIKDNGYHKVRVFTKNLETYDIFIINNTITNDNYTELLKSLDEKKLNDSINNLRNNVINLILYDSNQNININNINKIQYNLDIIDNDSKNYYNINITYNINNKNNTFEKRIILNENTFTTIYSIDIINKIHNDVEEKHKEYNENVKDTRTEELHNYNDENMNYIKNKEDDNHYNESTNDIKIETEESNTQDEKIENIENEIYDDINDDYDYNYESNRIIKENMEDINDKMTNENNENIYEPDDIVNNINY